MSMGLVVGGWFASPLISKLVCAILMYVADQYHYREDIKDKLKKLVANLKKIQAAVHKADDAHIENPGLLDWLMELKEAVYDAEDLLDSFEYKIQAERVSPSISGSIAKSTRNAVKQLFFSDKDVNELSKIIVRFEDAISQMGVFLNLLGSDQPQRHRIAINEVMECRQTSSNLTESCVLGRDKEIACLMNLLQNASSGSGIFSVISIVGNGATGKTTLAQCGFNHRRSRWHFDIRVWVCVSTDFDVMKITKEIVQSASIRRSNDFHSINNLSKIQEVLKNGLRRRKFLIVLDDVWKLNRKKWELLCSPFQYGRQGSRIILTTRNPVTARIVGTTETEKISLKGLAPEAYWNFFKQCAFRDANLEDYPKLESIGRDIARKLKGSPLAAKTLGGVLRAKLDVKHWNKILNSRLFEVKQGADDILPALRLSYDYMPPELKQCFVFCSLFPMNHAFERETFVRMWMAQGFIQPHNDKNLEDTAGEYFDELLQTSFFEHAGQENKNRYVIHDLLHEVADSVTLGEYCRIENDEAKQIPNSVRHLCVTNSNYLPNVYNSICELKNLRSLVLLGDVNMDCMDYREMIGKLKSLRLLIIWGFQGKLPEAIGNLIHLRYLDLYPTDTTNLPESLSKLYHLQGLRVHGSMHTSLPKRINSIFNVRYLKANINAISEIAGIGALTSLQELAEYRVKRVKGHEIGQLSEMNELQGRLQIRNLENVLNKKEAAEAKLDNKKHLDELSLEWRYPTKKVIPSGDYEEVLEALRPHSKLNGLWIKGYGGIKSPSWLKILPLRKDQFLQTTWLAELEEIHLENCECWAVLPPLGQLKSLKVLHMTGLNGVQNIGSKFYGPSTTGSTFPSLKELRFKSMNKWMVWSDMKEDCLLFPHLSGLFITDCQNLGGPLPLPSRLTELVLQNMPLEEDLASSPNGEVTDGSDIVSHKLRFCISDTLQLAGWLPATSLSSLQEMEIRDFSRHTSFEAEWFQHLTSLRQLTISNCVNLQTLPSQLVNLQSLEILRIVGCRQIQSLPNSGLPASLKQLLVNCCDPVLVEQFRENGLYWPKIAHISDIRITDSQNIVIYQRLPPPLLRKRASGTMLLMLFIGILLWNRGSFSVIDQGNRIIMKQLIDAITIKRRGFIEGPIKL